MKPWLPDTTPLVLTWQRGDRRSGTSDVIIPILDATGSHSTLVFDCVFKVGTTETARKVLRLRPNIGLHFLLLGIFRI